MSSTAVFDAIASLEAAVDDVLKRFDHGDLGCLSDEEFSEAAAELEATRRRLSTADFAVVAEIDSRDLPAKDLTRTAAGYLGRLWRVSATEARSRVREAHALGERVALTGEPLEPQRPQIAAARRLGILDRDHVKVMLRAFRELPAELSPEDLEASEQVLVDAARALGPDDLARVAQALVDAADPDGPEPDDGEPDPRRHLTLTRRKDGWSRLTGLLDPETTAMCDAWLAARSKPRPESLTADTPVAGGGLIGRDPRTAEQRRHDALSDMLSLALRADEYACATGSPVTVHVTMTAEQFESGTGHTVTSLGQRIRVSTALRMASQCRLAWLVHNSRGGILAYGRARRLATREQAEALLARDRGCVFPGCDIPPTWCERHHVREWQDGGPTDIDNMVLLCRYHHGRFAGQGWEIVMRNGDPPADEGVAGGGGVPEFIPPTHIDPDRKPLRNLRTLRAGPFDT